MLTPRVVHLPTRQKCKKFLEAVEKNTDWTWCDGSKPTSCNPWKVYMERTCIDFGKKMSYTGVGHSRNKKLVVMGFTDAMLRLERMGKQLKREKALAKKKKGLPAGKKYYMSKEKKLAQAPCPNCGAIHLVTKKAPKTVKKPKNKAQKAPVRRAKKKVKP